MIRIEELRLGNFLQVEGFNPKTIETASVTSISKDEIYCEDKRGSTLITSAGLELKEYGIPLTPEWLTRFGAIFPYQDFRCQIGMLTFYWNPSGALFLNDSGYNESITDYPIDQVHKLQNVIFALTGTELTLKP